MMLTTSCGWYQSSGGRWYKAGNPYISYEMLTCFSCLKPFMGRRYSSSRTGAKPQKFCGWSCRGMFFGRRDAARHLLAGGYGFKKGQTPHNYKGRIKHKTGYFVVTGNKKRVLEHRVVMEQVLGRPLLPSEVVHHINGNKADNRPENLQVFSSQGEHLYHHLKQKYEKET